MVIESNVESPICIFFMLLNLQFVDNIVIMAESIGDLGIILEDLHQVSQTVNLKMNTVKTKLMSNTHVSPSPVEYTYPGQVVQ